MALPAQAIAELKNFVAHAKQHPEVWGDSELGFLRDYLASTFGLPPSDFKR